MSRKIPKGVMDGIDLTNKWSMDTVRIMESSQPAMLCVFLKFAAVSMFFFFFLVIGRKQNNILALSQIT